LRANPASAPVVDVRTRRDQHGNFIAWDASTGKIAQTKAEKFSVWSGVLVTAGGIACYGTLEGYLKCVDANDINKELFKFKTPSGIIGNVFTREYKGKQYRRLLGYWRVGRHRHGRGPGEGPGRSWCRRWLQGLRDYTELGGSLNVFALQLVVAIDAGAPSAPAFFVTAGAAEPIAADRGPSVTDDTSDSWTTRMKFRLGRGLC
jgi:hypothetical protein